MKNPTGIVRKVDELGRLVIPIEIRRAMSLDIGESVEVFVNDTQVILKKYSPGCLYCGNIEAMMFKGKLICADCVQETKRHFQ
ncbi:AbrB/MazE/SpoVT family DNA-binding domain-containing protein [Paenibacillus aurantiacus]|uniref:AbrB/MazE/SpoVT family DNA-binding domain-containing protein n=1 Tax=Paenibacillus aurantiacus TaxID=1936118 RepID=A0ABV5KSJ8_9BACL